MSLEQYKDASRKELWEILQIQAEEMDKLQREKDEIRGALSESRRSVSRLEVGRNFLIEEFAEASCMGDLAKIARGYGYDGADNQ